ncbi:hypothetical protein [Marinimicrobium sp. C2-29]|uniref:hypothetical protein n=1 Tax=Marinimicrobium sp. C2-29 TaxID=3139825 RepID=UPI00313A073B
MARNDGITNSDDTKDTLLEELESIKGLLLEPEDDIPVLHEVIESIEPLEQGAPRQSSLFTTNIPAGGAAPTRRRPAPTKASGENPFLPAHIRARLHGNRPPPGFDSDSSAPARDTAPAPDRAPAPDTAESLNRSAADINREQLVNELLSELQPLLEAQLRDKLNNLSREQLRQLLDLEADTSDRD